MSLENLIELCKKWKFYRFSTLEDFDKRIDYNWNDVSRVRFDKWVVDEYREREYNIMTNACPTRWSAYWILD